MSGKSRQLQKRLDIALRALTQIECIANSSIDKPKWDSDLHWVMDGIGDLAHYAIEAAGDPVSERDEPATEAHGLEDEPFPVSGAGEEEEGEAGTGGSRRNN